MGDNGNGNGSKRERKTFEIECFYCGEKFNLFADHPCFISKAFCNKEECIAKHAKDKKKETKRCKRYREHLSAEKDRYKKKKKFAMVFFVDEEKKIVFRENDGGPPIRIGEIISEERIPEKFKDNEYVFVIEGLGLAGRINQYRRDVIRGLS